MYLHGADHVYFLDGKGLKCCHTELELTFLFIHRYSCCLYCPVGLVVPLIVITKQLVGGMFSQKRKSLKFNFDFILVYSQMGSSHSFCIQRMFMLEEFHYKICRGQEGLGSK